MSLLGLYSDKNDQKRTMTKNGGMSDGSETEEYDINVIYDGRTFQYEIPELLDK